MPWDPENVVFDQRVISGVRNDKGIIGVDEGSAESERILSSVSRSLSEESILVDLTRGVNITRESNIRMVSNEQHTSVTPENVARTLGIGLETAKHTLKVTTQKGIRHAVRPLTRRYRTDTLSMQYKRLHTKCYTDTKFGSVKSLKGNTCAQVYVTGNVCEGRFVYSHPMRSKAECCDSLQMFAEDIGVPNEMVMDGSKEQTSYGSQFQKTLRWLKCSARVTEPYSPWQNYAEGTIGLLAKQWRNRMATKKVPSRLWDYGIVYDSEILSRTCSVEGARTGYEHVTGETPDVSEWLDFSFYDPVWYWDMPSDEPKGSNIGRWLGVAHRVGSDMCYWVLKDNGTVVSRTTVQHITIDDLAKDDTARKLHEFDEKVKERLDDTNFQLHTDMDNAFFALDMQDDSAPDENELELNKEDNVIPDTDDILEKENATSDAFDGILNAKVLVPEGDTQVLGTVTKRLKDSDGNPVGVRSENPFADTRMYEVRLSDGTHRELTYNTIAQNLFAQCDSEGRYQQIIREISDHKSDESAIQKSDGYIDTHSGRRRRITTKGWSFLVEWTDGSSDWVPLKDLKES
jgi:hypothetical protein